MRREWLVAAALAGALATGRAAETAAEAAVPRSVGKTADADANPAPVERADAPAAQTDGEVWNAGVDFYRAGDATNALRVLRPLLLSKTHSARAAEVVARLEYERGNLEESAAAAQIALRATPEDAKANRNFTRATDRLPEERERKRVAAVLKAAEGKDPGATMKGATDEARALMKAAGTYRGERAEKAVALADSLSARARKIADTWLPLRETITQAVTNEEQAATILAQIEAAEAKTKKAAREFADLEAEAYASMSDVEHDFTRFLKLTALPPLALGEDLVAQSNAWQDVEQLNGRSWQQDALDYTRCFRAQFPAWAKAYEQQSQADTNREPFTAEAQAKISSLATELEKLQLECAEKILPPKQQEALELIRQIAELLPKDKNGGSSQNQQTPQNQQSQQQNGQQQQQDQNQQQQPQQDQSDAKQDENPEQQPEEREAEAQEGDEGDETPEDKEVEALLKKAQERNDEHEAEKKARMRKAPLPPNERDW